MPLFSLAGKSAVVTGAREGSMGHGIALALAELGANVCVCELPDRLASLDATVAGIEAHGVRALAIGADCTNRADIEAMFTQASRFNQFSMGIPIQSAGF